MRDPSEKERTGLKKMKKCEKTKKRDKRAGGGRGGGEDLSRP